MLKSHRSVRFSLRYKVALPVLIFVLFILFLQFRTTYRVVAAMVMERTESRLRAIAEVFAETIKVPLMLGNQEVLLANIEWMGKRSEVLSVRVEDTDGKILGTAQPGSSSDLPEPQVPDFVGAKRLTPDTYAVSVPILGYENRRLGRVYILFSQLGFQSELRKIFMERLVLAFSMALLLALATAVVTWLALRPLIKLKRAAQEILAGDLTARADIHSFDEIEELAEAFNEMVARLARSLDSLRARTEALEESEEKYRLIVENASDIIFMLSPQGELALLNEGFSGCSREELLKGGLPRMLSLHSADTRDKLLQALRQIEEKKEAVTNVPTTHIHQRSLSEIYYLTSLTPVLDHEGNLKQVQGVMRDVTELRSIEIMKESLIRDVAHELKTPTAKFEMALNWFEKVMETQKEKDKYSQILQILKSNTDRLMRTITSIMDLSKLESGMYKIEEQELNLNEVLEQVASDMEPLCRQKKIELERNFCKLPLRMMGDRDMLYRLFVNLIGNAVKFTEVGKIAIKSSLKGNEIFVEVSDTGLGIEKKDLEIVFERFVQKTASTVGIGVGLTITRQIAGLHHGSVWAESEGLGKGTTFKVKFPLYA